MLSLAGVEKARLDALRADNPDEEPPGLIASALGKILDHSADGKGRGLSLYSNKWNGQDDFITWRSDFGLACCAQLIHVPRSLRLVFPSQRTIFECYFLTVF